MIPTTPSQSHYFVVRPLLVGFLASCVLLIASCGAGLAPDQRPVVMSMTSIYGGKPVVGDDWLNVVGLAYARDDGRYQIECTGTLITPRIVLTAAHCLNGFSTDAKLVESLKIYVGLGVEGGSVEALYDVKSVGRHPLHRRHPLGQADVGYVLLDADVKDVPTLPLLTERVAIHGRLASREPATLVGYGRRDDRGLGVKYQVDAPMGDYNANEALIGADGRDACAGDSGGPAFVSLADGHWAQLGIVSRGRRLDCGPGGYVGLVADSICWLEHEISEDLGGRRLGCDWMPPPYAVDELDGLDVLAMCKEEDFANDTQTATIAALRLATGAKTCDEMLRRVKKTKALNLSSFWLKDVSPLAAFSHLESLDLSGNLIEDVTPLGRLTRLRQLDLTANLVRDWTPLAAQLSSGLWLLGESRQRHNAFATAFLSQCLDQDLQEPARRTIRAVFWKMMAEDCETANERLLGVRSLTLADHGLTDLAPLSGLAQLKSLDIARNHIEDLTPLTGLKALERLDLSGTGVASTAALDDLVAHGLTIIGP